MPFKLIRNDITEMHVDAIVNAANRSLAQGGGVCGAIFQKAGAAKMAKACKPLAPISTGKAVLTPGFALPARYVIHAAGPVFANYTPEEARSLLARTYQSALQLADENEIRSLAFPLISSGIYGFPIDQALQVAMTTILDFLKDHEMDVYLAVFNRESFAQSRKLAGEVESYIEDNYAEEHTDRSRSESFELDDFELDDEEELVHAAPSLVEAPHFATAAAAEGMPEDEEDHFIVDEPFNQKLFHLIDAKGMSDVDVYKRANLDRKLFSKIRSRKNYIPSKKTILSLAIALKLTLQETDELLESAGYALSRSLLFDVIVEFFIQKQKYDIFKINEVLFLYDQPLLGSL